MATVFVETKGLPPELRTPLLALGYSKKDVAIVAEENYSPSGAFGDGFRAIVTLVNLDTAETRTERGAWGGENIFGLLPADDTNGRVTMRPGIAIIDAQEGGGRPVSARIVLHPGSVAPLLPVATGLSEREKRILAVFRGIKSSYRKEYFDRMQIAPSEVQALISGGYLSQNKAGATSITTAGKNACQGVNVS